MLTHLRRLKPEDITKFFVFECKKMMISSFGIKQYEKIDVMITSIFSVIGEMNVKSFSDIPLKLSVFLVLSVLLLHYILDFLLAKTPISCKIEVYVVLWG